MSAAAWLPAVKPQKPHSLTSKFRHLGAFGLFVLAILDSSPVPTLGGPDILTTILSASHRNPWYEYTAVAAAGSVIGAYMTFRLARKAGEAYLQKHFTRKARGMLDFFNRWGTSALAVSTAVPFPFPTSVFFAAAGASKYETRKFVVVVLVCRSVRYAAIGIVADYYGRHFIRVLRHPGEYWVSLSLLALCVFGLSVFAILLSRHKPATEVAPAAFAEREFAKQARD